jgi:hypothetical protein
MVFDGALTTMLSMFKRTESSEPFHIFIFTMDVSHLKANYTPITQKQSDFLDGIAKSYNKANLVKVYDVTDMYMTHFSGCPNEGAYCSPYTLIRLLADEVPGTPDRFL